MITNGATVTLKEIRRCVLFPTCVGVDSVHQTSQAALLVVQTVALVAQWEEQERCAALPIVNGRGDVTITKHTKRSTKGMTQIMFEKFSSPDVAEYMMTIHTGLGYSFTDKTYVVDLTEYLAKISGKRTSGPCTKSVSRTSNHGVVSASMSGVAKRVRVSGQLNSNHRTVAVNLIPFLGFTVS